MNKLITSIISIHPDYDPPSPSPSSVQNNIVKSRACTTIRNTCMNEMMIHNRTCTATPMCNKPLSFHTDNYCAWYKNYTRLFPLCFKPTHAIQNKPIKGDNRVQKGNLQQDTSQFTLGSWGLVPRRDGGMSHNLQHFMISKPPTPPQGAKPHQSLRNATQWEIYTRWLAVVC